MRPQLNGSVSAEAITLATVPDFALSGLWIQPSLRKAGACGREVSVEPRVMQALIALAQADGAVVSRDVLIERCWDGRIVGDDAINRCIAKVRRLAEITEPASFAIETVSKVGYRLKVECGGSPAPVAIRLTQSMLADALAVQSEGEQASKQAWWVVPCLVFGLMVTAAGIAVWRSQPQPRWTVQSSRTLLYGLEAESDPRISPDGSMLAYAAGLQGGHRRIYVRNLAGGTPVAVSSQDDDAESAAWASDGRHLAYAAFDRPTGHCRIMVAELAGGTAHAVGLCRHSRTTQLAWQPDTTILFFEDEPPPLFFSAIFRIDVATGRREQVTWPRDSESDAGGRISPDGMWLAYLHGRGAQGAKLRLRKLASGEEHELACDPAITSFDWTPDSQTLVADVARHAGGDVVAYPIDGARSTQIYTSASALGQIATGLHGMLAMEVAAGRTTLARASRTPRASADVIDPARGTADWPAFGPDGTLAFVSTRSGRIALWARKPGGQPVEIVHPGMDNIQRPVFSPDGSRIAFVEVWKGSITVHVVTAQGVKVAAFAVPSIGFGLPNWTPDGDHLLLFDKRLLQVVSIDVLHSDHREPVGEPVWDGTTYRKGALYAHRGLEAGLWQVDGNPRLITPKYPATREAGLAFLGDDVLLPDPGDDADLSILAQKLTGGPDRVAFYAPAAEPGTPLAVDPRTGEVIYVSQVASDSHIDLLTVVRQ